MDDKTRAVYYEWAEHLYGEKQQMMKAAEELCECAAAIMRLLTTHRPEALEEAQGEVADAGIMVQQMKRLLGTAVVNTVEAHKLRRLRGRLIDTLVERQMEWAHELGYSLLRETAGADAKAALEAEPPMRPREWYSRKGAPHVGGCEARP